MATGHEETLQQRYQREHDEYLARIESMTTAQIMAIDVQLEAVTAQRDQLLAVLGMIVGCENEWASGVAERAIAAVKGE